MYIRVPDELRTDRGYWDNSFPMRVYLRVMYALAAGLYASAIMATFPIPFITQCAIVGVIMIYVLLFRTIHPNGFGFSSKYVEEKGKAKQELEEGNMEGVPEFLQKAMHYPTAEELAERKAEHEQTKAEWDEYRAARKAEREARKAARKNDHDASKAD